MEENINRIGMALEFLSFWLVTPEILGEERLRTAQRWVRETLQGVMRWWKILFGLAVVMAIPSFFVVALDTQAFTNWEIDIIDPHSGLNMPALFTWMAGSWGLSVGVWSVIRSAGSHAEFQGYTGVFFHTVIWAIAIFSLFFAVFLAGAVLTIPFVNEPLIPHLSWGWSIVAGLTGVSALIIAIMGAFGWSNWRVWRLAVTVGGVSGIIWWVKGFGAYQIAAEFLTLSFIILGTFIVLQEHVIPPWLGELADSARTRRWLFWSGVLCFVTGFGFQMWATF